LGAADILPLGARNTGLFTIPGVDAPEGAQGFTVNVYRVDHGYVSAMGIPLLSGRGIEETDDSGAPDVVVVSQGAARRFWPDDSPIGKSVATSTGDRSFTVVGVVGDVKVERLGETTQPTFYFSMAQRPGGDLYLVASGNGSPAELAADIRRAVVELDPDLLIMNIQTLEERLGVNLYPARLAAAFLGTFGLLALFLAAIGLYGVVSLSVSRRTRELGIRMAVGADRGSVVGMVLRGSLASVALGGLLGLGLAFAGALLIRSFLFGVEPADPATLVTVPILLGLVAAAAAFLPARRASRVDPVEALRTE
jgi:predicted permease